MKRKRQRGYEREEQVMESKETQKDRKVTSKLVNPWNISYFRPFVFRICDDELSMKSKILVQILKSTLWALINDFVKSLLVLVIFIGRSRCQIRNGKMPRVVKTRVSCHFLFFFCDIEETLFGNKILFRLPFTIQIL